MSPSWKYLSVGIVVAVILSSAALQAEAWWGSRGGGWGGAGCYGVGGSSVYCATIGCPEACNSCGCGCSGCGLYAPSTLGRYYYTSCDTGCGLATYGGIGGAGGSSGTVRMDDGGKR